MHTSCYTIVCRNTSNVHPATNGASLEPTPLLSCKLTPQKPNIALRTVAANSGAKTRICNTAAQAHCRQPQQASTSTHLNTCFKLPAKLYTPAAASFRHHPTSPAVYLCAGAVAG
jgi:hypothetical protein